MSNYAEYFGKLASDSDMKNEIDFGVSNHQRFLYTHPNQLRTMNLHHSKKISHSKQNDLLGAIQMLGKLNSMKPILPISEYTKQVKPFNISETEKLTNNPLNKDKKKPEPKPQPKSMRRPLDPKDMFKPKVKGQVSNQDYFKMSEDDQLDYDKRMATAFKEKGLGAYRPPMPPKPEPKLAPPPSGLQYLGGGF